MTPILSNLSCIAPAILRVVFGPAIAISFFWYGDQTSAQETPGPAAAIADAENLPDQATLDARFAELLSGAKLVGHFTDDARPPGDRSLKEEKYTLGEVRKLDGDLWLFQTRIQYGEHDVTLPLSLPVRWAGDTPVITLDNLPIPGFGVFSARVLFHGDRYAGDWQGANHGGHLFGRIERAVPSSTAETP